MARPPPAPAADLRLPGAILEYAIGLPGDHLKLVLRLLQRARWIQTDTARGPAHELRFLLSVEDLWDAILLDRDAIQDVDAFRHVLRRLERGDWLDDEAKAASTASDEEEATK